jgi:hypothetical protein
MRWKAVLLALLIVSPLAIPSRPVAAEPTADDAAIERLDSKKFWDYAACGASIVFASGTGGWILAGLMCGKVITEHWTE